MTTRKLTPKQERFAAAYVETGNASEAYRRAYDSRAKPETVHRQAHELLHTPKIAARVAELRAAALSAAKITAQDVLERWWALANVDVNELVRYVHHACRYCYGISHAYHWIDEAEYWQAVAAQQKTDELLPPPSNDGGYGYNRNDPPAADCPRCFGKGVQHVDIADTRALSPAARMLYDGVKQTRDGIEVKLRDRDKALENVAKFLGMFKDRVELSNPDGSLRPATIDTSKMSTAALRELLNARADPDDTTKR